MREPVFARTGLVFEHDFFVGAENTFRQLARFRKRQRQMSGYLFVRRMNANDFEEGKV